MPISLHHELGDGFHLQREGNSPTTGHETQNAHGNHHWAWLPATAEGEKVRPKTLPSAPFHKRKQQPHSLFCITGKLGKGKHDLCYRGTQTGAGHENEMLTKELVPHPEPTSWESSATIKQVFVYRLLSEGDGLLRQKAEFNLLSLQQMLSV